MGSGEPPVLSVALDVYFEWTGSTLFLFSISLCVLVTTW